MFQKLLQKASIWDQSGISGSNRLEMRVTWREAVQMTDFAIHTVLSWYHPGPIAFRGSDSCKKVWGVIDHKMHP